MVLKFRDVRVAVDIGCSKSDVLSTLPNSTIALDIPLTVPVKVGLASGAFISSAICVAVDIGLVNRMCYLHCLVQPLL